MDKTIKDKWVRALRSGKYTQTQSVLHDVVNDTFCCLGVFCDLVTPPSHRRLNADKNKEAFYNSTGFIPDILCRVYGIDSLGEVPGLRCRNDLPVNLLNLNDTDRLTFDQIADVIEYFF